VAIQVLMTFLVLNLKLMVRLLEGTALGAG
jgi:hypothetical protein